MMPDNQSVTEDRKTNECHIIISWRALSCIAIITALCLAVFLGLNIFYERGYSNENNITQNSQFTDQFINRFMWGANPVLVKYPHGHDNNIITITITQTNTSSCNSFVSCSKIVREIQKRDIEIMKSIDIIYNFLIGGDGNVYEGRGWKGASNKWYSKWSVMRVAFIGDYSIFGRADVLTEKQITAFKEFVNKNALMFYMGSPGVDIECCTWNGNQTSFVGYNLFQFFYFAYYPLSCYQYGLNHANYNMCEYNKSILDEGK